MHGFKDTRPAALRKAAAPKTKRTQLPLPSPQGIVDQVMVDTTLHPDLLQSP